MIIKSSQRAGHRNLAAHLVKTQDIDGTPQTATFTGARDLLIDEVRGIHQIVKEALQDMQILSMASQRCQKDLYHVSISPDKEMSAADWATAWEVYEQEFGLSHLPYIEVTHAKDSANGDRREPHVHRVYERVDTTTGLAVHLSHTRVRNEKVARLLEYALGHELTVGKHNRAVIERLAADGVEDVVHWMQQGQADVCDRPVAAQTYQDVMMEKRTAFSTEEIAAVLQTCYENAATGLEFMAEIRQQGFELAQGTRRDFVIVDGAGGIHSPRRRLGVKAQELRERWSDIPKELLEPVDAVVQRRKRAAGYGDGFRQPMGVHGGNARQELLTAHHHVPHRKRRRKKKQKVMVGRGSWKQRLVEEERV